MRVRACPLVVLVLAAVLTLSACGNGGGLRVEGAETPVASASPSVRGFAPTQTPEKRTPPAVTVSLAQVRLELLANKNLEPFFRTVLVKCEVVERCLTRGPTVNVLKSNYPQLVVMVHTGEKFVYGAVLMAIEPAGPRQVWSLRGERLKISESQQQDLVVESGIFAVDDKPCCPSVTRVEVYRWTGRQMIKLSSQDQKGD
ncbi:hypothetical protein EV643_11190 [Kribbella sp. VKM Ac-2527]|uniref:LppP/LprE lipoprotein n=1 Tax=Kribbella caucasensis TaxID=2512215 RepID=A0A4R6K987_9ACTN|nr:hypothetical protein [Kribbella sp. VKM Ac-2527]TDO46238.1 hypothetical protein EV643_11190 [Kribbella sp. VKM Ac-2527]